jgi:hypothetical protein
MKDLLYTSSWWCLLYPSKAEVVTTVANMAMLCSVKNSEWKVSKTWVAKCVKKRWGWRVECPTRETFLFLNQFQLLFFIIIFIIFIFYFFLFIFLGVKFLKRGYGPGCTCHGKGEGFIDRGNTLRRAGVEHVTRLGRSCHIFHMVLASRVPLSWMSKMSPRTVSKIV